MDPEEYRSPCEASGGGKQIIVLQNNWIAGNDAKVSRARRWGHWFLDDGNLEPSTSTGAACLPLAHLADAVQTVLTAVPPGGPPTDIEMHRR